LGGLLLLGSLSGCGEIDGSQPFAGTMRYQPTDHGYTVHYLSPPWILVTSDDEVAAFAIAPSLLSIDLEHATMRLLVEPNAARAAQAATVALAAYTASHPGARVPDTTAPVRNHLAQVGQEFSAFDPAVGLYHREVCFDGGVGSFRLTFEGRVDVESPDVTSLVTGFGTGAQADDL
jgi:hypothetical protein